MKKIYKIKSKAWLWPAEKAAWHFLSVDKKISEELKSAYGKNAKGFGSLPVEAKIGKTKWKTSVFPDKKSGTYLLPLKADVRRKEGVFEGDTVVFEIEIKV